MSVMIKGKIDPQFHTVLFTRGEGPKCLFALADKHFFSTTCLEHILEIIYKCDQNGDADKKLFSEMLRWYINFRKTLVALIFKTVKKTTFVQPK